MIVKLAIELVELVQYGQEHHSPLSDREVIVLLDYSSGDVVVVFRPSEEIKVCTKVVILHFKFALLIWSCYRLKHLDCLLYAILELQIVDKNHLFLQS